MTATIRIWNRVTALYSIENPDGDGDYLVDWNDVEGATAYTLEEDDDPDFSTPTTVCNGMDSQYPVTERIDGVWYYRVKASVTGGDGLWSGTRSVTVDTSGRSAYLPLIMRNWPPSLAAPTLNVISNSDGNGSYTVSWSAISSATSYALQEAKSSDLFGAMEIYSGPGTSHSVTERGAARYYYYVQAHNSWGSSGRSNVQWVDVLWEKDEYIQVVNLSPGKHYIRAVRGVSDTGSEQPYRLRAVYE